MPSMPYSTGYLKATSNSRAHSQGFCMETSGASGTFRGCKAIHVSVGECCLVLVDVTGYLIPIQHISYFFYFLVVKKGFIFFFSELMPFLLYLQQFSDFECVDVSSILYFICFFLFLTGFLIWLSLFLLLFISVIVDDHCCEFLQLATLARDRTRLVRDRTRLV
ncbi:uncharacterized protein [Rutidosis leptorrhynchoides]|uniref:uncharacterized protein isoform X1 n=1 Tax=Rutidosis leptorrhynchoides TaxID=125765 RepID=UPI003A9921D3